MPKIEGARTVVVVIIVGILLSACVVLKHAQDIRDVVKGLCPGVSKICQRMPCKAFLYFDLQ
jgi:hypothetical protein